jgi:membrane-associated phospholipid phosphatase
LIAALFAATGSRGEPLPYEPARDLSVTGGAGLLWLLSAALETGLAPSSCRWCNPPGFDAAARDALRWRDTAAAQTASDLLGYAGMPLATLAVDFAASDGDLKTAGTDALIAAESAALAGLAGQGVKFLVGRERPFAHAGGASLADAGADRNLSFYSGHTSFTTAVAVSTATCASLRGSSRAWAVWATGLSLAAATGYMRIAADRHYLSDVVAGAGAGALFGVLVPTLFHRPSSSGGSQASIVPNQGGLVFAGRF